MVLNFLSEYDVYSFLISVTRFGKLRHNSQDAAAALSLNVFKMSCAFLFNCFYLKLTSRYPNRYESI